VVLLFNYKLLNIFCFITGVIATLILSLSVTVYLPVRAISEALGLSVSWDNDTKTVTLTSQDERIDPLNQAVTDGVITQTEADAINKVLMPSQPNRQSQSEGQ